MGEQELLGGLADLGLRGITVPAAGGEGTALERRSGPVKHEDGADAEEEELADAAEEPEEVGVADHLPLSSRIALMNCTIQMLASTATRFPARVSTDTRRPTGASSSKCRLRNLQRMKRCTPYMTELSKIGHITFFYSSLKNHNKSQKNRKMENPFVLDLE
jgi:hypothetical protein